MLLVSQPPAIVISIDSNGVVEADIKLMIQEGLNEVKLPAEPIPETIDVQVDNMTLIPIYDNGSLYFFSPTSGEAEITYLVNVSSEDNIFSFRIVGENLTSLKISPQIILLSAPEKVESLEYVEDTLLIRLYGPEEIDYAVRRPSTPTRERTTIPETTASPTVEEKTTATTSPYELTTGIMETVTTATAATTEKLTTTQLPTTSREQVGAAVSYYWIVIAAVVIGVSAAGLLALLFSRRRGEGDRILSSVDRMILERIAEAGGSVLQGELQSELMLPKTTLWRHVKKLEKLGYIQIVKEGPFNRLILIRDFR